MSVQVDQKAKVCNYLFYLRTFRYNIKTYENHDFKE